LISDPVERWKNSLGDSTWETYVVWWKIFKRFAEEKYKIVSADELVKLSPQDAGDVASAFHSWLQSQGYSSSSSSCAYGTVRSFFSYNGIRLAKAGSKFKGHSEFESRVVLTQKQVFQTIEAIHNYRDKAASAIALMGQRDGLVCCLKVRYIQTKDWKNASVVVFDIPDFVPDINGRNQNKRNVKYRFAILNDIVQFIKLHLEERERAGERITSESWLFRSRCIGRGIKVSFSDSRVSPIRSGYLNSLIKRAAEKLGFQWTVQTRRGHKRFAVHAQIGRRYFKTQTRLAGVDPELREFMLGHVVGYGGAYDKYDEREVSTAMEQARTRLSLTPEPLDELERRKQALLDSARLMLKPEALERLQLDLQKANTSEEIDVVLDNFKNGKEQLEQVKAK
jgi:hypothetical protein